MYLDIKEVLFLLFYFQFVFKDPAPESYYT